MNGHRLRHRLFLGVALGVALGACTTLVGIDGYVVGACKGGLCDAGSAADVLDLDQGVSAPDDSGVPCQGRAAPAGLRIGSPGNTFCIDTTEVTVGDYAAFLAAGVSLASQPAECAWNDSFLPDPTDAGAELPVVGIDRCDALAYCAWAGKYLCGTVENGRKTGPVTIASASDYRSHQWLLACSAEARLRFPYGSLLDPGACNFVEYDAGALLPVGAAAGCVGGFAGLHDLLGNAWEWYDGPCIAAGTLEVDGGDGGPASDRCWIKGGSYLDNAGVDCRGDNPGVRRDLRAPNVGFRCCAD